MLGRLGSILIGLVMAVMASASLAAGAPAKPGEATERLRAVEQTLKAQSAKKERLSGEAATLDKELGSLRDKLVDVAEKAHRFEKDILDLEETLAGLTRTQRFLLARLSSQRQVFGRVLMVLARMARHPPEALIAQPLSPGDTVRAAILLRAAVPRIEIRAAGLRDDLAKLSGTRQEITLRKTQLASAVSGLKEKHASLKTLHAKRSDLRRRKGTESRRAARRVAVRSRNARTLLDLVSRLEKERQARARKAETLASQEKARAAKLAKIKVPAPPKARPAPAKAKEVAARVPAEPQPLKPLRSFRRARGSLPYPVVGRLVGRYGQATGGGLTRKGIRIATRSGAQAIAPYDGTVVFSGRFRGYGQLLIIEHSEGYHSLLAGLARIDGVIGQRVVKGEPIGVMGTPKNGKPTLYVELRRNGQPINPVPWLAARKHKARKGKVNG
jgi:murein hydrolase activator